MSKPEWQDYSKVGTATPEQIARVEARVGHVFPADVRQALLAHQGMKPTPNKVTIQPGRPAKGFGALGHCVEGKNGNIARTWELMRSWEDSPYPTWLVPISIGKGLAHFALDYRNDEQHPSVVWINTDLIVEDPGFVAEVASSFTDLLRSME